MIRTTDQNLEETSQYPLRRYPGTTEMIDSYENKQTKMDLTQHSSMQSESENESSFKVPSKCDRKIIKRKIKIQERRKLSGQSGSGTESDTSQKSQIPSNENIIDNIEDGAAVRSK